MLICNGRAMPRCPRHPQDGDRTGKCIDENDAKQAVSHRKTHHIAMPNGSYRSVKRYVSFRFATNKAFSFAFSVSATSILRKNQMLKGESRQRTFPFRLCRLNAGLAVSADTDRAFVPSGMLCPVASGAPFRATYAGASRPNAVSHSSGNQGDITKRKQKDKVFRLFTWR